MISDVDDSDLEIWNAAGFFLGYNLRNGRKCKEIGRKNGMEMEMGLEDIGVFMSFMEGTEDCCRDGKVTFESGWVDWFSGGMRNDGLETCISSQM